MQVRNDAINESATAPLYTELPYPGDGVVRTGPAKILRLGLARYAPELLRRPGLRIIDVGCGTGESTAGIAKLFPNAMVVGVDINPASLELASGLANRNRLGVRFAWANITNGLWESIVECLGSQQAFDVVTSHGVLHHLPEPRVGFSEVRRLIQPDGLFQCYMYSKFGRRDDDFIKDLVDRTFPDRATFESRATAISQLRLSSKHSFSLFLSSLLSRWRFGPPISIKELVQVYFRRKKLAHISDSFSNPCEYNYRFEELRQLVEITGWKLVALAEQGGLPVSAADFSNNLQTLSMLESMPEDALYDYFAFHYRADGFTFYCRPEKS